MKKNCGICGSITSTILDLGEMPAANKFGSNKLYSLNLQFCYDCKTVQLGDLIPPSDLFSDYYHLSGASADNVAHLQEVASFITDRFGRMLEILEIGSNDGTLLEMLHNRGNHVQGVDPAKNLDWKANTIVAFYSYKLSRELSKQDIIIALNVVAHTPDVLDLLEGVQNNLEIHGTFFMETAYISNLLRGQYDTIYHEHVYTFSLTALINIFKRVNLTITDAELIDTQGGSLRILAQKSETHPIVHGSVFKILLDEVKAGVLEHNFLSDLETKAREHSRQLREICHTVSKSRKIIAVGAPARGVVLLNYQSTHWPWRIDYAVDDTSLKQGKTIPGMNIPVYSWDALANENHLAPPVFLLLSWNYRDSLIPRLHNHFAHPTVILPFPELDILTS